MQISDIEPLAVAPKMAMQLMQCGPTHLYDLIKRGELEVYKEGRHTRITMRSIHARMERLLQKAA
jgi:excisionase family DNA binding protein